MSYIWLRITWGTTYFFFNITFLDIETNYLFAFDQNQRNVIKRNNFLLFIFNMLTTSNNVKKTNPLTELPTHVSGIMLMITNSPIKQLSYISQDYF